MSKSTNSNRVPDFIIGGAPRSGTTWLYVLLDRHPDIHMAQPRVPEPKFFLVDELYERGVGYYAQTWFAQTHGAAVVGEKSTNYLESSVAAARIREHLPDVKLIFILREPVSRAYSNYLWSKMNGLEQEDFARALDLEERRERDLPRALRYARPHAYFSRGLYAKLLRPYFAVFPRESILCLRYEDITGAPGDLVARVHQFLGVTPRRHDFEGIGTVNASVHDGSRIPEHTVRTLLERYAGPNRRLAELLGPGFEVWETP